MGTDVRSRIGDWSPWEWVQSWRLGMDLRSRVAGKLGHVKMDMRPTFGDWGLWERIFDE